MEFVWLRQQAGWQPAEILSRELGPDRMTVRLVLRLQSLEEVTVVQSLPENSDVDELGELNDIKQRNVDEEGGTDTGANVEDLITLTHLNEPEILNSLALRFK